MKTRKIMIMALLMVAALVSCSKDEIAEPIKGQQSQAVQSTEMVRFAIDTGSSNDIIGFKINGISITEPYFEIKVPRGSMVTITADGNSLDSDYNKMYIYQGNEDVVSRYIGCSSQIGFGNYTHVFSVAAINDYTGYYISRVNLNLKPDMWLIADPTLYTTIISGTAECITMQPTRFNPDSEGILYFEQWLYPDSDCYIYKVVDGGYAYYTYIPFDVEENIYFESGFTYLMSNRDDLDPNYHP